MTAASVSTLLALTLLTAGSSAEAAQAFKFQPRPGAVGYSYTMAETNNGQAASGYRVDFDLVSDPNGGLVAVIKRAAKGRGDHWETAQVDAACAKALHAGKGELARITLSPLSPAASTFGDDFINHCAPDAVFFPMTDILNVALVQMQSRFGLPRLTSPGDSATYDGFSTSLTRASSDITAAAPGGETQLFALSPHQVTVDWVPKPMALTIVEHTTEHGDVRLNGTEHFAFRLQIDPATGELLQAATLYDTLDMVVRVPGLDPAKAPHLAIGRTVMIERR